MPRTLDKIVFDTGHAARIGWFFGQKLLAAKLSRPIAAPPELAGRSMPDRQRLVADLWRLVEQDWRNVAAGIYAAPEETSGGGGLFGELRRTADFFADLGSVEDARHGKPAAALLKTSAAQRYPAYYRRRFHFQTDGYLSRASAERYDHQVEVLFGGGAATMRRQALVPLRQALQRASGDGRGQRESGRLLDIGCGTGAFLREIKRNYPRLAVTGLDLSAPYLAVARRRLAEWSRVTLVEGAAEAIPLPDMQFDVVTCVYLFHELPSRIRRVVAGEIRRILKPGGTLILVDSLQPGDVPDYDALLDYFPVAAHEPYYKSYLCEDLDRLMQPGLTPDASSLAYFSKVVTYRCGDPPPIPHNM